jgi:hypothetical protein
MSTKVATTLFIPDLVWALSRTSKGSQPLLSGGVYYGGSICSRLPPSELMQERQDNYVEPE